ncbi:helix-turn-helix domain-containing protein [Streptomyces sp. NPDC002039]|uniref:helix-turn-helix domain-containing protein n=1 Tax=unclassified Streptomyces TaxID=2593676 RepID=UPI00331BA49F
MDISARNPHQRRERDRTLAVLHALEALGAGPHRFRAIANRTELDDSTVHRRLLRLFNAGLCDRPRFGHWELRPATGAMADLPPGLVHPSRAPVRGATLLLEGIHRRTRQVVLLHTYSPLGGERVCISAAGTSLPRFRRELALTPGAVDRLRRAPLHCDAPGLAMLANLAGQDVPLRDDLRRIRSAQVAVTGSPLPGWSLVSAPLRRLPGAPAAPGAEPRVVAAISILAPDLTQGNAHVAYGPMLRNAVQAVLHNSAAVTRPLAAASRAA